MDKYEFNLKLDQIKSLTAEGDYDAAAEIADTMNWNKVKNVNALVKAGEVYENVGRYEEAREILLTAYDRSPVGRNILYRLAEVAVKMGDFSAATAYYNEFVEIAPHDNLRYVIRYHMRKAQGADLPELISILEEYKDVEYTEEWAYELAFLYHKAGMTEKCVQTCDELILWFGEGDYVERALELKMLYKPLSKPQEDKYRRFQMKKSGMTAISPEEMARAGEYVHDPVAIPPIDVSTEKYNTVNLQKEIAKGIQQIIDATEKETVADTMDNIKKIVEDVPYLKLQLDDTQRIAVAQQQQADAVIDSSIRTDFSELLGEEESAEAEPGEDADSSDQIEGQMSISDVLGDWEKTKRAAEAALSAADEKKLQTAKAVALQEAEDIMERLNEVIPMLDAGVSTNDLLKEEYLSRTDETPAEEEGSFDFNSILMEEEPIPEIDLVAVSSERRQDGPDVVTEMDEAALEAASLSLAAQIRAMTQEQEPEEMPLEEIRLDEILPEEEVYDAADDENAAEANAAGIDAADEAKAAEEKASAAAAVGAAAAGAAAAGAAAAGAAAGADAQKAGSVNEGNENAAEANAAEANAAGIDAADEAKAAEEKASAAAANKKEESATKAAQNREEKSSMEERKSMEEELFSAENTKIDEDADVSDISRELLAALYDEETAAKEALQPTSEREPEPKAEPTWEDEAGAAIGPEANPSENAAADAAKSKAPNPAANEAAGAAQSAAPNPNARSLEDLMNTIRSSTDRGAAYSQTPPITRMQDIIAEEEAKAAEEEMEQEHLTDEQKAVFSYFVPVSGMEHQLSHALRLISEHLMREESAKTGNLVIVGGKGCGKTVLATSMIRALQKETGRPNNQVGKISAEALNRKNIQQLLKKVQGGCLIIEEAGNLSKASAVSLSLLMEQDMSGTLVVLEDTSKGIRKALSLDDGFSKKFTETVSVPIFTNDELVTFADSYSKELGYALDEMAVLALHNRISNIQRLDQETTLTQVKEIVDEAIEREDHAAMRKFFGNLTAKRYTADDRIVLKEKDFAKP